MSDTCYILTCPHCGALKAVWHHCFSIYLTWPTLWSDYRKYHPKREWASVVQRCPTCKHYFIRRFPYIRTKTLCYTSNRGLLPYPNLKQALEQFLSEGINSNDELIVRQQVLHAYNDLYGCVYHKDIPIEELKYNKQNVLRFIQLLENDDLSEPLKQHTLYIAELYREIGEFSQCMKTLKMPFMAATAIEKIMFNKVEELCLQQDTRVFIITHTDYLERIPIKEADDEPAYDPDKDVPEYEDEDW